MLVARTGARREGHRALTNQLAVLPMMHIDAIRAQITGQHSAIRQWLHPMSVRTFLSWQRPMPLTA